MEDSGWMTGNIVTVRGGIYAVEGQIPARHHYRNDHTMRWSKTIGDLDEWAHKPVSILCYGGHGGFQAAMAMKLVSSGISTPRWVATESRSRPYPPSSLTDCPEISWRTGGNPVLNFPRFDKRRILQAERPPQEFAELITRDSSPPCRRSRQRDHRPAIVPDGRSPLHLLRRSWVHCVH